MNRFKDSRIVPWSGRLEIAVFGERAWFVCGTLRSLGAYPFMRYDQMEMARTIARELNCVLTILVNDRNCC